MNKLFNENEIINLYHQFVKKDDLYYRKFEKLPFEDEIDWNQFCVLIDVNDIQNIDTILSSYTPDRIKQIQDNLYNYWVDNFTMKSICQKIIKRI